jgi:Phospholipase_D-nuclease N-terminal
VLFFGGFLGVLMLGLWIFCCVDVMTTPDRAVRNLPKLAWVFIVVLLFNLGSIAWLIAGRPWNLNTRDVSIRTPGAPSARPRAAGRRPTSPDDDPEFLASLRTQAREQGRKAREERDKKPPE